MNHTIPIARNLCSLALEQLLYSPDGRGHRIFTDLSVVDECQPVLHMFNTVTLVALTLYFAVRFNRKRPRTRDQESQCE